MVKRPLTPPPSSTQELQDQARGSNMQCDSSPLTTIPPTANFRSIIEFSSQNKSLELIRTAEQADLASCGDPTNPSRLFILAPLVLAYLIVDDLAPAKHALLRLPDPLSSVPLSILIRNLSTACWQRAYEQVYTHAKKLNDLLLQPDFFDKDLANVLTQLVASFTESFRRRTALLMMEAYTALPLPLATRYLGMDKEQLHVVAERERWQYDTSTDTLCANLKLETRSTFKPGALTSSLSTFRHVVNSVSQLEL